MDPYQEDMEIAHEEKPNKKKKKGKNKKVKVKQEPMEDP
jgi:hypothetical protein